jgi:hypothetical protein
MSHDKVLSSIKPVVEGVARTLVLQIASQAQASPTNTKMRYQPGWEVTVLAQARR